MNPAALVFAAIVIIAAFVLITRGVVKRVRARRERQAQEAKELAGIRDSVQTVGELLEHYEEDAELSVSVLTEAFIRHNRNLVAAEERGLVEDLVSKLASAVETSRIKARRREARDALKEAVDEWLNGSDYDEVMRALMSILTLRESYIDVCDDELMAEVDFAYTWDENCAMLTKSVRDYADDLATRAPATIEAYEDLGKLIEHTQTESLLSRYAKSGLTHPEDWNLWTVRHVRTPGLEDFRNLPEELRSLRLGDACAEALEGEFSNNGWRQLCHAMVVIARVEALSQRERALYAGLYERLQLLAAQLRRRLPHTEWSPTAMA